MAHIIVSFLSNMALHSATVSQLDVDIHIICDHAFSISVLEFQVESLLSLLNFSRKKDSKSYF